MEILSKPCGDFKTNCYILKYKNSEIVIDPGQNSFDWIKKNSKNLLAVLCTHAHFDHILEADKLQNEGLKVYLHKDDLMIYEKDPFYFKTSHTKPDILIQDEKSIKIGDFNINFLHYPGHTPGSCIIKVNDLYFSGDVIFKGSIGRYDFVFSSKEQTKQTLQNLLKIEDNWQIYPGHGKSTTLNDEKENLRHFLLNL